MDWLNIHASTLDSPEFLGASPVGRATWLCLMRCCAGQENGGRIEGAKHWTDSKWQQVVRVKLKEVNSTCDLWHWDGEDLVLAFYPVDKEAQVKRNRANGASGGRPAKALKKPSVEAKKNQEGNPNGNPAETTWFGFAETEGKGKAEEGKGITPNPPEGESGRRVLPERWRNIPKQDRRNHKVLCNNRLMERIGKWFGRRDDTLWTLAEGIALNEIRPPNEDVAVLEGYYLALIDRDTDYRRRDLITLLNNWNGELDRARIWKAEQS